MQVVVHCKSITQLIINYKYKYKIMQEEHIAKTEKLVLQLNKTGLSYLSNQNGSSNAFDYFKKAEKLLISQIQIDNKNKKFQSLLAVTYNNLAIYYKRTNKPKAALTYLKKALQIQAFSLQDWLASASTHLNICAIYSFMRKYILDQIRHQEAVDHANLSIQNAQKAKSQNQGKSQKDAMIQKSCNNIQLASIYNLAVQYQHLKRYEQAIETYKKSTEKAKNLGRKNIEVNSQQGIDRISSQLSKNKKKLIQILQKKRESQQRGNYESMRRNKKNVKIISNQQSGVIVKAEKYNLYNNDTDYKKRTQSVNKITTLNPIRSRSTEGIKRVKQQNSTGRNEGK